MGISLKNFSPTVRKYNSDAYLMTLIKRVNNGEGYLSMNNNRVIFNEFLKGRSKVLRDSNSDYSKVRIDL